MNAGIIIDLVIVIIVIASVFRGWEIGWVRQFFSTVGFFGGLFIGAALQPHIINLAHTVLSRTIMTLVITLGIAFLLLFVGEVIGYKLKEKIHIKKLNTVDNLLGSVLSLVTILFTIWLFASILSSLSFPNFQKNINQSSIITFMNKHLPSAPTIISDVGSLIDPNGFPQVFIGSEPTPNTNYSLPSSSQMQQAVNQDASSVVKIEGIGCGGIVEGSGFIVAKDIVATNAHVVAGIAQPYIYDNNGAHPATVIWFDPNLDFAVLKTSNLSGNPLNIDPNIAKDGTPGAVIGYPGGGPLNAGTAVILDEFNAEGRNIYGNGNTYRSVYEIRAKVIPGNSGGPLILKNGQVDGVVFAESTSYKDIGYALTSGQIIPAIHQAISQNKIHSTGSCAE